MIVLIIINAQSGEIITECRSITKWSDEKKEDETWDLDWHWQEKVKRNNNIAFRVCSFLQRDNYSPVPFFPRESSVCKLFGKAIKSVSLKKRYWIQSMHCFVLADWKMDQESHGFERNQWNVSKSKLWKKLRLCNPTRKRFEKFYYT